jgi:hypothetical protein
MIEKGFGMKTVLKTLLLLTLVTSALADDAAIKKQLVGTWKYDGQIIVLNADGSMNNTIKTWDVRNGKYIETKKSGATYTLSILKLTKTSVTLRSEDHSRGIGTWTRVQ